MSRFGITTYGTDTYGAGAHEYDARPFAATPTDFGEITLSWYNPGGSYDRVRLVRNQYGTPETSQDGSVLLDVASGNQATTRFPAVTHYIDDGQDITGVQPGPGLPPGFWYYSIFVRAINLTTHQKVWIRCSDVETVAVTDQGMLDYLLSRLPSMYTNDDGQVGGVGSKDSFASRYVDLFARDLTRFNLLAQGLLKVYDTDQTPQALLPYLMNELGLAYEPALGHRANRLLAHNAVTLARMKGTRIGVELLGSAATSWTSVLRPVRNMLLRPTDGMPVGTDLGRWSTGGTVTLAASTDLTPPVSPVDTFTVEGTETTDLSGHSIFKATNGGGSPTTNPVITYSNGVPGGYIPIDPARKYTFSSWWSSGSSGNSHRISISVVWYDGNSNFLQLQNQPTLATGWTTSGWTRMIYANLTPYPGAAFARINMTVDSLNAGESIYFAGCQFERNAASTSYHAPRKIELELDSGRVNELSNPGFDTDVSTWALASGTSVTWSSATTYDNGAGSCRVFSSSVTAGISTTFGCDPQMGFSAAAQVYLQSGICNARLQVIWYDSLNDVLAVNSGPTLAINSTTNTGWNRLTLITNTPVGATSGQLSIITTNAAGVTYTAPQYGGGQYSQTVFGQGVASTPSSAYSSGAYSNVPYSASAGTFIVLFVDDVLAEQTGTIYDYFDARNNPGELVSEKSGTGRQHLYENLAIKAARLNQLLGDNMPLGVAYAYRLAPPRVRDGIWKYASDNSYRWADYAGSTWGAPFAPTAAVPRVSWNSIAAENWNQVTGTWNNPTSL